MYTPKTTTITGRLSSPDPNIQNIPIRSELVSELRKCLVEEAKITASSADYAQIERRLLGDL